MSAWLVTWESPNAASLPKKRIAAVLDGRTSSEQVRRIVEALYASYHYTEAEMVAFRKVGKNPYPANFGDVNGVPYNGEVSCGHNPFLWARLVDDLKAGPSGSVTWSERPRPTPPVLES